MMEQNDTFDLSVLVNYISGVKEDVALAVKDLPGSMTAGFYPPIDTPSYSSIIRLRTLNADTGTYNIRVIATSSKLTKEQNVKIRVVPQTINPAALLAGTYLETGMCSTSGSVSHTATISAYSSTWNKIKIEGFWHAGSANTVIADIDPGTHALIIPAQIVNNVTITGGGSYTATELTISYSVTNGLSFVDNCNSVFTKQ
jgi:hypothetical protein